MSDPAAGAANEPPGAASRGALALLLLALACYGVLQLGRLGHPLLWQDEAETAMFAERILEFGYPKVHDDRNVVYGMGVPLALGVVEEYDAYIGSLWGQYYWATLGVLLARAGEDLHTRTALLRLPFVLAGAAGLALLFAAVGPVFAGRRERLLAAAGYTGLLCISISLLLHLREVRYYALGVLLLACVVAPWLRGALGRGLRAVWRQAALQALALIALFNVFYPAAVAAALWLLLEALLEGRRGHGPLRARLRAAAPTLASVAALALVATPIAAWFEIRSLSSVFSERWGFGPSGYLQNLGLLLQYLLRYELLAPWLALVLLRLALRGEGQGRAELASAALARLAGVQALVGAGNPIFFERYFVPLGPLLALGVVLEATAIVRRLALRRRRGAGASPARGLVPLLALLLLATLFVRRDELVGRLSELARPCHGPLDFAIPALQQLRPDAASLRIATNYEAEVYMYYLGSQVVGRFHAATPEANAREAAVEVDVVIPRRRQPKTLEPVLRYLAQGEFERHTLPVVDLPYNNIPELFRGRVLETTHHFRTPRPRSEAEALSLHLRLPEG